ncbi:MULTISPECIES: hypothetical protein [Kyrpidia]|uniref:Uncharacterized protein n=1 Tax=Kyrpidia spormannii TaxID=2055160 RepID=A0ACA8Z9J4_9BACL|nr:MULTISPECIES: hypothetical protein [Kyrpidia]MCL6574792.1 hypothetical protein [Kyrpidia sp.]CAB3392584.1 conserved protein of unknown function [Kyrpidia spormannii]HHY66976.1 hypothetical protein [Alicyclobacillus sp.]
MDKPQQKSTQKKEPTVAPGLNGVEGLEEDASPKEKARGDFTRVTRLVWDEVESGPSKSSTNQPG